MIALEDVIRVAETLPADRINDTEVADALDTGRCAYTYPNGEHCIAGEILVRLGATVPRAHESANELRIRGLCSSLHIPITQTAMDWLFRAQDIADSGFTWGEAVEAANSVQR